MYTKVEKTLFRFLKLNNQIWGRLNNWVGTLAASICVQWLQPIFKTIVNWNNLPPMSSKYLLHHHPEITGWQAPPNFIKPKIFACLHIIANCRNVYNFWYPLAYMFANYILRYKFKVTVFDLDPPGYKSVYCFFRKIKPLIFRDLLDF